MFVLAQWTAQCKQARGTVQETAKSSMEAAQILDRVVARFIGTKHERDIKKLQPVIAAINAREAEVHPLSNEELKTRFGAPRPGPGAIKGRRPRRAKLQRGIAESAGARDCAGIRIGPRSRPPLPEHASL